MGGLLRGTGGCAWRLRLSAPGGSPAGNRVGGASRPRPPTPPRTYRIRRFLQCRNASYCVTRFTSPCAANHRQRPGWAHQMLHLTRDSNSKPRKLEPRPHKDKELARSGLCARVPQKSCGALRGRGLLSTPLFRLSSRVLAPTVASCAEPKSPDCAWPRRTAAAGLRRSG